MVVVVAWQVAWQVTREEEFGEGSKVSEGCRLRGWTIKENEEDEGEGSVILTAMELMCRRDNLGGNKKEKKRRGKWRSRRGGSAVALQLQETAKGRRK